MSYDFENPHDYEHEIIFDIYDAQVTPLSLTPLNFVVSLEQRVFVTPRGTESSQLTASAKLIRLLDVNVTFHSVRCDMKWKPLENDTPRTIGTVFIVTTTCMVPLLPSSGAVVSDDSITFECYVSGVVAFAVYPVLHSKSVIESDHSLVALHTYMVEFPLMTTGTHVLNSKITYFDGHGQADIGSPQYLTHFPHSLAMEDFSIESLPSSDTSPIADTLPPCTGRHFFEAEPSIESTFLWPKMYWLSTKSCERADSLPMQPHDKARCASFISLCNRDGPTNSGPSIGNNGAVSALSRICNSTWLIAHRECLFDMSPARIFGPAHDNLARVSSRFGTVALYGGSISDVERFAIMELLGVPTDCLQKTSNSVMNCLFFSHTSSGGASLHGDDIDAVLRLKWKRERTLFEIASAFPESHLIGLNILHSNYPSSCEGESYFCAADNLPPLSRHWSPAVGKLIDVGVEMFGNNIRHCSPHTCPVCQNYSHCFRKSFADDIRNMSRGRPMLVMLEAPFVGHTQLFVSNFNLIFHSLADSLLKGSCVLIKNGHGLHSNLDIDRKFPMRANIGSRTRSFESLLSTIWRKAWFTHQGLCSGVTNASPPIECSNKIEATGLVRLLRVLNTASLHQRHDMCEWGVAKMDSSAFGSGRPDASRDGVHFYSESGGKDFRMGNEVVINVAAALMSALQ